MYVCVCVCVCVCVYVCVYIYKHIYGNRGKAIERLRSNREADLDWFVAFALRSSTQVSAIYITCYTHTHTHTHTHMFVEFALRSSPPRCLRYIVYLYIYVHTQVICTHIHPGHVYTHTHKHTFRYTYIHTYIHTCRYIDICVYHIDICSSHLVSPSPPCLRYIMQVYTLYRIFDI